MVPLPKRRRLTPTPTSDATTADSVDCFLKSILATEDPALSIGLSLDRIFDSIPRLSDQESLVDAATRVASALMDSATRRARRLAATHNFSVWPLPDHLTTKVFSMLDTESVCCAGATCSLFWKCALDPSCYANIGLTRSVAEVSDQVVYTMIQRAGKKLQSIKLGRLPQDKKTSEKCILTGSCLSVLKHNGGAAGSLLRQLHLYNLEMDCHNLYQALSTCQSLVELKIVGLTIQLVTMMRTISGHCHSIERLSIDIRHTRTRFFCLLNLEAWEFENLIKKCPLLSSLAFKGYRIKDNQLCGLIKGACGIKSLDLSGSCFFAGNFLRDLGNGGGINSLETLILRDCHHLIARDVSDFLSAVNRGDWKALRYVDISNRKGGLIHESGQFIRRCAVDVSEILQERPDIHLIADYSTYSSSDESSSSSSSDTSSSSDDVDTSSSSDDEDTSSTSSDD